MKLYTKSGDDGSTSLFGGKRVPKADLRVASYGDVDELNAAIGIVVTTCDDAETEAALTAIQAELFSLGAELAAGDPAKAQAHVTQAQIDKMERQIDAAEAECTPLSQFILPGGTTVASGLHFARTVCRRAERSVVELSAAQPVDKLAVVYLNRLSDLLFAFARRANHRAGVPDVPWKKPNA